MQLCNFLLAAPHAGQTERQIDGGEEMSDVPGVRLRQAHGELMTPDHN